MAEAVAPMDITNTGNFGRGKTTNDSSSMSAIFGGYDKNVSYLNEFLTLYDSFPYSIHFLRRMRLPEIAEEEVRIKASLPLTFKIEK